MGEVSLEFPISFKSFFLIWKQQIKMKRNEKLIMIAYLNIKNVVLTAKINYMGNMDLCPNLCGSVFRQKKSQQISVIFFSEITENYQSKRR